MGKSVDFLDYMDEKLQLEEPDLREYSPLVLAYIGDDIFDLIIRTMLVKQCNCQVQKLHRQASMLVKASAQAAMAEKVMPLLTEEEMRIYRRGHNAKPHTTAKNATLSDYHKATGLEALMGYLYLKKDMERIVDLIHAGLQDDKKDEQSSGGRI